MLALRQHHYRHALATALYGAGGALLLVLAFTPGFWTNQGEPTPWWYPVAFVAMPALTAAATTALTWGARPKTYRRLLIAAVAVFVVAAVLHNLMYGLSGVEEPVFLLLAIWGAPALLVAGLVGLVRTGVRGFWIWLHRREKRPGAHA
jgi:hypothetical protein